MTSQDAFDPTQMWCTTFIDSVPVDSAPAGTNIVLGEFTPGTGEPQTRQNAHSQSPSGFQRFEPPQITGRFNSRLFNNSRANREATYRPCVKPIELFRLNPTNDKSTQ